MAISRNKTRLELLNLAKKNNNAVISDLRNVNRIVEKVKKEEN